MSTTATTTTLPSHQPPSKLGSSAWSNFAAYFADPHPVRRAPNYLQAHASPGAMHYARRFGRTAVVYVPVLVCFFSWPFVVKAIIDANNGLYSSKAKTVRSKRAARKQAIDLEVQDLKMAD